MSEEAKKIGESIARACNLLPEAERKYLLGYADGVAAACSAGRAPDGAGKRLEGQKVENAKDSA